MGVDSGLISPTINIVPAHLSKTELTLRNPTFSEGLLLGPRKLKTSLLMIEISNFNFLKICHVQILCTLNRGREVESSGYTQCSLDLLMGNL